MVEDLKYSLIEDLKKLDGITDENGKIIKEKCISKINNLDEDIINVVLNNIELHKLLVQKVNNVLVIDKEKLKDIFLTESYIPNSFTNYSNKIGISSNNGLIFQNNEVILDFPYKDTILLGNQSKEENEGVRQKYFHEVINYDEISTLFSKKVYCNFEIHGDKDTYDDTSNIIIKGNNLIALHTLTYNYSNKVKLIYIDPPYNTESLKFAYNDKFDHATWLTFMKNRLEISKELLAEDGVIVVEIDYNQQAYLKVLMDNIFGIDNHINTVSVKSSTPSGLKVSQADKTIIKTQHFLLCYKKNEVKIKPQYSKKDDFDTHYSFYLEKKDDKIEIKSLLKELKDKKILTDKQTLKDFDIKNKIHKKFYIENGDYIVRKSTHENEEVKKITANKKDEVLLINGHYYINNDMLQPLSKSFNKVLVGTKIETDISNVICDFWDDIDYQNTQNQGGISFPAGKKPEQLLYRIINMFTDEGDLVLDFHLGSGTTAAVAHKMNRRYIGIEQIDYGANSAVNRLKNVILGEKSGMSKALNWNGGGSFVYVELYNRCEDIYKQIQALNKDSEADKIAKLLVGEKFKIYLGFNSQKKLYTDILKNSNFKNLNFDEKIEILISAIDKNNIYVDLDDMNDKSLGISKTDKTFNLLFYKLKGKND